MTKEKTLQNNTNDDNALKLEALKAAITSGFLSGFTSAANQISVKVVGKALTPEEVQFYSKLAAQGAEWYLPKLLDSPEGQAIAEVLEVTLPTKELDPKQDSE